MFFSFSFFGGGGATPTTVSCFTWPFPIRNLTFLQSSDAMFDKSKDASTHLSQHDAMHKN